MRVKIKTLKKVVKEALEGTCEPEKEEGVSQTKRLKRGYKGETPADYDLPGEGLSDVEEAKEMEEGGWKRVKRASGKGYSEEQPETHGDYKAAGEFMKLGEIAKQVEDEKIDESAVSEKGEEFVKKHKKDFQKRYGPRWREVLYATANSKFPAK